ncbi:MAG: NAD-dependent epimerase/dehydratase family protein [Pelagibacteraceae bacterium]|nr:NAD-dependent epimerase/dehydratase family protein [Pelagibacteraceae bacterium]
MKKINIFCFGFGQVAKNFIKKLNTKNTKINLTVTSREETNKKVFDGIEYDSFQFSQDSFDKKLIKNLESSNYILVSIAPISGEDIVIKNFQNIFEGKKIKWLTYLSATSVYGDHKGEWVDEKSKTNPTSSKGTERLKAEKSWIKLAEDQKLPVQIFRLSGVYSNENNVLKRLKSGDARIIKKENQFFSRIHVEDIAEVLFKSLEQFKAKEIYNISDDRPASSEEVILFGSKLLNVDPPAVIELKSIENEMTRNFYKDSKKINNKKMKRIFDYKLKYSTYVEGLTNIYNNFI